MTEKNDNRVRALLANLKLYQWERRSFDTRTQQYIYCSPFCPPEQRPAGTTLEPVLRTSDWDLGDDAVLTVNSANRLVMNSRNLMILDMDRGEYRFNKWAVRDSQQVIDYLHDLRALDSERLQSRLFIDGVEPDPLPFLWSEQTWKIYSTQGGVRVICTSMPFPLTSFDSAQEFIKLCRFLGVDPIYAEKCREQQCYRARLTPKYAGDEPVCEHVITLWKDEPPLAELAGQVELHDDVTGYNSRLSVAVPECENDDEEFLKQLNAI